MMNCKQITRLLSDSLEHKLSLKEKIITRMHIVFCAGCRNFGRQMLILREITRMYVKGKGNDAGKHQE